MDAATASYEGGISICLDLPRLRVGLAIGTNGGNLVGTARELFVFWVGSRTGFTLMCLVTEMDESLSVWSVFSASPLLQRFFFLGSRQPLGPVKHNQNIEKVMIGLKGMLLAQRPEH